MAGLYRPLFFGVSAMSNETTQIVLSICGIAAVVGVLIVLAGFLAIRVLKMSIFGLGINAMKVFMEPKEEPTTLDYRAQSVARPRSSDLRAQAHNVDFDSAVERQRSNTNPISAQTVRPAPTPSSSDSRPLRPRRTRERGHEISEEDMGEILDGFEEND